MREKQREKWNRGLTQKQKGRKMNIFKRLDAIPSPYSTILALLLSTIFAVYCIFASEISLGAGILIGSYITIILISCTFFKRIIMRKRFFKSKMKSFLILGILCLSQISYSAIIIKPFLINPGKKTITIRWESDQSKKGIVSYWRGKPTEKLQLVSEVKAVSHPRSAKDKTIVTTYWHQVVIKGLTPGSEYSYQVKTSSVTTPVKHFRTFPEKADNFTFIVYGDPHHCPARHRKVVKHFKQYKPAFIICVGDFVSTGKNYYEWKEQAFSPLSDVIDEIAIFPMRGNHDLGSPYFEHFGISPEQPCWSFDYGDAHFISLDVFQWKYHIRRWFEKDISSTKTLWKFVFCHYPIFDTVFRGNSSMLKYYVKFFEKFGVDAYFSGHCHCYQRFVPLISDDAKNKKPVTYVVTGGGGAYLAPKVNKHPFHAAAARKHHFIVVNLNGKKLTARVYDINNTLIDSFSFSKEGDVYNKEYMAMIKQSSPVGAETIIRDRLPYCISVDEPMHKGKTIKMHCTLNIPELKQKTQLKLSLDGVGRKNYKIVPEVWQGIITPGVKAPIFETDATALVEPIRKRWGFRPQFYMKAEYYMPDSGLKGTFLFTPRLNFKYNGK